jgi:predicted membrane protein
MKSKRTRNFGTFHFFVCAVALIFGIIAQSNGMLAVAGVSFITSIILDVGADILQEVEK